MARPRLTTHRLTTHRLTTHRLATHRLTTHRCNPSAGNRSAGIPSAGNPSAGGSDRKAANRASAPPASVTTATNVSWLGPRPTAGDPGRGSASPARRARRRCVRYQLSARSIGQGTAIGRRRQRPGRPARARRNRLVSSGRAPVERRVEQRRHPDMPPGPHRVTQSTKPG